MDFHTSPLIWRLRNPLKSERTWIFSPTVGPETLCTLSAQNYNVMKMEDSVRSDPLLLLGQSQTKKLRNLPFAKPFYRQFLCRILIQHRKSSSRRWFQFCVQDGKVNQLLLRRTVSPDIRI
jgi:hypothetical protein